MPARGIASRATRDSAKAAPPNKRLFFGGKRQGEPLSPQSPPQPKAHKFGSFESLQEDDFPQEEETISSVRATVRRFLDSQAFDILMGLVVTFNCVVMALEADSNASCFMAKEAYNLRCSSTKVAIAATCSQINAVLLLFYTVELVTKVCTFRSAFFRSPWNLLDLCIVALGLMDFWLSSLLPSLQLVRIFRTARLIRVVKMMGMFKELNSMLISFLHAMKAMFWGFVMISIMVCFWSVMAVEILNPFMVLTDFEGDEMCEHAFVSVLNAILFFFQTLVVGDSWGRCTIPILKEFPELFALFAGAFVCVQLGFMNLILSVIVDKSAEAREILKREEEQMKEQQERMAARQLLELFAGLDSDGNGKISCAEFVTGMAEDHDMRNICATLKIDPSNVEEIFALVDTDGSGALNCKEFMEAFKNIRGLDLQFELMRHKLMMSQMNMALADVYAVCKNQEANSRKEPAVPDCISDLQSQFAQFAQRFEEEQSKSLARHMELLRSLTIADLGTEAASTSALQKPVCTDAPMYTDAWMVQNAAGLWTASCNAPEHCSTAPPLFTSSPLLAALKGADVLKASEGASRCGWKAPAPLIDPVAHWFISI